MKYLVCITIELILIVFAVIIGFNGENKDVVIYLLWLSIAAKTASDYLKKEDKKQP